MVFTNFVIQCLIIIGIIVGTSSIIGAVIIRKLPDEEEEEGEEI